MFQQILNFVLGNAWILLIVLGGVFNVTVRLVQKAKVQRARRDALHEMARQEQEALRTGRSVAKPSPTSVSPAPMQDAKAQRRERIEALRQERMEQLRALREKRAGSSAGQAAASFSSASQNHPNMPPIPVQARPQRPQSPQPTHRQQPTSRPQSRPAQPTPAQPRRRQIVATAQPVEGTRRRSSQPPKKTQPKAASQPKARSAGKLETIRGASKSARPHLSKSADSFVAGSSARSMLRSRSSIRQAMILREILDTPIALRDQDIASGSLFS